MITIYVTKHLLKVQHNSEAFRKCTNCYELWTYHLSTLHHSNWQKSLAQGAVQRMQKMNLRKHPHIKTAQEGIEKHFLSRNNTEI